MSNCDRFQQLLVELVYDEIEPSAARELRDHLDSCAPCAARHAAFGAVRDDLGAWDVAEPEPLRTTFITVGAPPRRNSWTRRLAAAASFVVGFLLIAALANLEVTGGESGWTIRTSLLPRPAGEATQADGAQRTANGPVERLEADQPRFGVPVAQQGPEGAAGRYEFMSEDELDSWLDRRLQARGWRREAQVANVAPEQVRPLIDELMREREQQTRRLVEQMLTNLETRQREELEGLLSGMYQTFDVQRTNDFMFFASELGLLQEATGQELQRTNAALDYLIGLESTGQTLPAGTRQEPQRQEPERQEPQR